MPMPQTFSQGEPIVALATPPGVGALAVIRTSGAGVVELLTPLFPGEPPLPEWKPRNMMLRELVFRGEVLDQVMAVRFAAPASFTGEDMVEIFTHGGWTVPRRILHALLEIGFREARPGEFTFRAVFHGKMDLVQAQAVHELVVSGSEEGARLALRRLSGEDSREYAAIREALLGLLMEMEAQIDFPEDVPPVDPATLLERLERALRQVERTLEEGERGRRWVESHQVILVGPPNAGKSTLFNAVLGEERAIVTELPGTTRDVLRERVIFEGIPLAFLDTAGLRATPDPVEAEGIRRVRAQLDEVDLVLFVASPDTPYEEAWQVFRAWNFEGPVIWIWNKIDRYPPPESTPDAVPVVALSAREGTGLEALARTLREVLLAHPPKRVLSERDLRRFRAARSRLLEAHERLAAGQPLEVVTLVVREAVRELEELLGIEDLTEAVLDEIFSHFCIGK